MPEKLDHKGLEDFARERGIDLLDVLLFDGKECFFPFFRFLLREISNGVWEISGESPFGTFDRTYHDIYTLFVNAELDALELALRRHKRSDVLYVYLTYKLIRRAGSVNANYDEEVFGSFLIQNGHISVEYDGRDDFLELRKAARTVYAPMADMAQLKALIRNILD